MANNCSPAFLFYPKDFASDGKVEAMTTEQVGGYILLLCKAWWEEPAGSLPNNDSILARWARLDEASWAAGKTAILAPFALGTDGRWHQKRMRSEHDKFCASRKRREKAAKKAAAGRWAKKTDEVDEARINNEENANGIRIACESHSKDMRNGCIPSSSSSSKEEYIYPPPLKIESPPENRNGNQGRQISHYLDALVTAWGPPITPGEKSRFENVSKKFKKAEIDPAEISVRKSIAEKAMKHPCPPETLEEYWSSFTNSNGNGSTESDDALQAELKRTREYLAEQSQLRQQLADEEAQCTKNQ